MEHNQICENGYYYINGKKYIATKFGKFINEEYTIDHIVEQSYDKYYRDYSN